MEVETACAVLCCQQVHRGRYKNEVDVAVKTMKEGSMQEADFIDEAKTMMYFFTDNFVVLKTHRCTT